MDQQERLTYEWVLARIRDADKTQASSLNLTDPPDGGLATPPPELAQLKYLIELNLRGWCRLTDLSLLSVLRSLQLLNVSRCQEIRDLTPLSGLASLQSLNISECQEIRDLTPLSGLASLQSLNVSGCQEIRDLTPLSGLASLQSLNVSGCQEIRDLTPLSGLASLQSLNVSWCQEIRDLTPLSGLSSLQSLNVSWCEGICDLTPLSGLASLQSLNISQCQEIRDLTPLTGLSSLQSLNISECQEIRDLTPLTGLSSLQSLHVFRCQEIRDLTPLSGLSSLQSLNVSECQEIRDLTPLSGLTSLQSLNVSWCQEIRDLTPLSALTSLQSLNISECRDLRDLTPLSGLVSLQSLNVSGCKSIRGLTALSGLVSLQSLNISECQEIRDLTPLSGLAALLSLHVFRCQEIRDLTPLSGLASLQSLNISECREIRDLRPLSGLVSLQSLDVSWCQEIRDLTPLSGLASLQSLDVSGCQDLRDLTPLSGLASLQSLNVSRCQDLRDLTPLSGLRMLRRLDICNCSNRLQFAVIHALLPTLHELRLYGTQWTDLPSEICGDNQFQNVLDAVRAHYLDLNAGAITNSELKILFLGNGGLGKSQLCRRLSGKPYDPNLTTTHGIQLTQKQLESQTPGNPIVLNLWDFGGQEIYHGSHSLFLQGQSLFLLLWTPEKEQTTPYREQGVEMRHRPLPYWLDYLRWFSGTDIPLLLIQSQCDTAAQRVLPPLAGDALQTFTAHQVLQVSAKTGRGLDVVNASLTQAVHDFLEAHPPPPIGAGRARVRSRLRDLLAADQERPANKRLHQWLERDYFNQLCDEAGGIGNTEALLDFLHRTGVLFYRPTLFSSRIILDQNWALAAIYTLFDRGKTLPLLRGHGRFNRADLEILAWSQYTRDEQLVFLGMMESCGICFKIRKLPDNEWEYIAPELLPPWSQAQDSLLTGRLLKEPPTEEAEAKYGFLHEGLLRNFLSKIGRQAGDEAIYWKYGCWFYEKTTGCRVLIDSRWQSPDADTGPGSIHFRAWGQRAHDLIEPLLKELQSLPLGQPPALFWSKSQRQTSEEPKTLQSLDITTAVHPAAGSPTVYLSYAWGPGNSPDLEQLCTALESEGWNVVRDRTAMQYGDLITGFMKTITRADRIIAVLSAKYLSSPFCMTELHGIYSHSINEKQDFLNRVIPLSMDDAKFTHWRDRVAVARHWRTEFEEMEKHVRDLSQTDFGLYKAMQNWHNQVGDILAYVSDTLHPQGFQTITQNHFAALKQMLAPANPFTDFGKLPFPPSSAT